MAVGIDKAATEYASIELYTRMAIKGVVILLYANNLATCSIYSYKRLVIKPLWCQQVVGGYLSEC